MPTKKILQQNQRPIKTKVKTQKDQSPGSQILIIKKIYWKSK